MKVSNNALNFLLAQYRAIFKRAYVKGLASAVLLTLKLLTLLMTLIQTYKVLQKSLLTAPTPKLPFLVALAVQPSTGLLL